MERVFSTPRNRLGVLLPITLVSLEEKFILCDGHHTAIKFMIEQLPIPAEILETDNDIANSIRGALSHRDNRKDVIDKYLSYWEPLCRTNGIINIKDLRKKYKPEIQKYERELKRLRQAS